MDVDGMCEIYGIYDEPVLDCAESRVLAPSLMEICTTVDGEDRPAYPNKRPHTNDRDICFETEVSVCN